MKKLIVLGIIATMVMGMAVAASAAVDATWAVVIKSFNVANNQSGSQMTANTKPEATDGFIEPGEDSTGPLASSGMATIYSDIFERCNKDTRAPLLVGESKVFNLSTAIMGQTTGSIRLDMWVASEIDPSTDGDPNVLVQLFKGSELIWTAPLGVKSTSKNPMFSYNVDAGTQLQLVASTIVPEPGSMVALFSGLVGLVGFGIRRRK